MITYIKINGFKSFHNFEMEFAPFTVIAGANASGKSNLFDALRQMDKMNIDIVYSEEFPTDGVGQAIMNRLLKSAGYKTIKA